tara:strand:- start:757 stop:1191 length:435 start_codon:yes stop_codon:yes gene_type:complete
MGAFLNTNSKSKSKRSKRAPMAEINVTPFVDVMLVLLIIFMVAAPLMTAGVSVDLPDSAAPALSQDDSDPIQLSLDANGTIYLDEQEVVPEQLLPMLETMTQGDMETRIYIRGDQSLSYGVIMSLMGVVNKAGYNKVALITQPK